MGQFESGKWIIRLSLYFFSFFLIVFAIINITNQLDYIDNSDISYVDPGFMTLNNNPLEQTGECTGNQAGGCSDYDNNQNNCDFVPGCNYTNSSVSCFSPPCCTGDILDPTHIKSIWAVRCSDVLDFNGSSKLCSLINGCTWSDFTSKSGSDEIKLTKSFDWTAVKSTIGIMTGFSAEIGVPVAYRFIFSFIFFWIPFFMLIWSIYMALPLLH